MALQISSAVLGAVLRSNVLSLAKTCSIGNQKVGTTKDSC